MKFIADAMLGRLAKWLRLLGFDVLYYPDIDDRELIRIAMEKERAVLTRDTRLAKDRRLRDCIFIESDNISGQLAEMKARLNFGGNARSSRCAVCNGELSRVSQKMEIKEYVPDFIYHNFNDFSRCGDCGRVYWEGTHRKKIREKLARVLPEPFDRMRSEKRR